jgi:Zn-dependent protease with chaperone function
MQLYPILLVLALAAADGGLALDLGAGRLGDGGRFLVATVPVAVILAIAAVAIDRCRRRMHAGGDPRVILVADRVGSAARWLVLASYLAAVLLFGWFDLVRARVGDLVLVDEVIALAPPIAGLLGAWWLQYPIERRLREAVLLRRLDRGSPIHPLPSRARFVTAQARSGLLLLLVPILLIVALDEIIEIVGAGSWHRPVPAWALETLTIFAALSVFVVSPFLARIVLTVRPLAAGEARDRLMAICRTHGVSVREVLLWQTGGSVINAAVIGLIGPLRYVLLTDALLELMSAEQVRAVMAHEVAHVKRHHMPWLVITLVATIWSVAMITRVPLLLIEADGAMTVMPVWLEMVVVGVQLALALIVFGWISRRFERQADTFAAQHLSGMGSDGAGEGDGLISEEASEAMRGALGRIAQLNSVDPARPSWRHGSIDWRRRYLRSIVGRPIGALPIDRVIRWIKTSAAVVLAILVAGELLAGAGGPATDPPPVNVGAEPSAPPVSIPSPERRPQ